MPDLRISVESAEAVPFAISPALALKLRVTNVDPAEKIHTVVLRAQVQIEAPRRRYTAPEQERLRDLFGEPERWGQTLRNLLWVNASAIVPRFTGTTTVDLQIPCTFDFAVATTKYFNGLSDGEIPLLLMFSGSIFHEDAAGDLRVAPVPWDKEAKYRLPLKLWKDTIDIFYPNSAWLCLRRDVFEELHRFKVQSGLPGWEQTFEMLLARLRKAEDAERAQQESAAVQV
ncbi:MAG TPA: DUF6084 family protein [Bryobacteraceae bacterium]|jgi:hypothetical protein|nr:DUF6084 family protein [Bryobacteraceae bacterium]